MVGYGCIICIGNLGDVYEVVVEVIVVNGVSVLDSFLCWCGFLCVVFEF